MALIKCLECGKQISSNAESCPHCGNPIKKTNTTIPVYENKTVRVVCWGLGGSNAIIDKLSNELNSGWEIVSTIEDHWRGGMLRHVYTVVLKRKRTAPVSVYKEESNSGWICKKCGSRNNSNSLFCSGCGTYK